MIAKRIVIGQRVSDEKRARAKELRALMTEAERELWRCVKANKLDGWHFRRQQIIDGFIVDFYCHKAGLVVELDGSAHEDTKEYDSQRDELLCSKGFKVLRFANNQVLFEMDSVLEKIREILSLLPAKEGGVQSL